MQWDLIISNALYAALAVNAIGYALIAIGLNVHFGYTGLLNFGQAGFAAIGAYAVAVTIAQYDWSLWAALPLIFVGGVALGLILGVPDPPPARRLPRHRHHRHGGDHPPLPELRAVPLAVRRHRWPAGLHRRRPEPQPDVRPLPGLGAVVRRL